jgi:DeoR/GlpR family transcriptional regulator of sugar metabolism
MLKEERQRTIIDLLHQDGKVLAADLITLLNVSEDTVRRDLNDLAEAGILQRVHGGALPRSPSLPYEQRVRETDAAKRAIAQAAARLIHDGQVVFMDSGSTVLEVVSYLPTNLRATIVTNSLPVAAALVHHTEIEVQVLGGRLKRDALAMVGVPVVETLRQLRADLCVLGICGLHPEIGISMSDVEEAYVKRVMIEQAAEVVAVAGAAKLGTAAPYVIGPISALTYLVTDGSIEPHVLAPYQERGTIVHIRAYVPLPDFDQRTDVCVADKSTHRIGRKALPGGRHCDEALLYVGNLINQSGNLRPGVLPSEILRLTQQACLSFEQCSSLRLVPFCQKGLRIQIAPNSKWEGEVEQMPGEMLRHLRTQGFCQHAQRSHAAVDLWPAWISLQSRLIWEKSREQGRSSLLMLDV